MCVCVFGTGVGDRSRKNQSSQTGACWDGEEAIQVGEEHMKRNTPTF